MIKTTNIQTTQETARISKYFNVGKHEVKIVNIEASKASTGNYQLRFLVESPPVTTEGFVPSEGHNGVIGTVKTLYLSNTEAEKQVSELIAMLGDKLGVREAIDNIQSTDMEGYATELTNIVKDKYFYMTINGREYVNNNNGKTGLELQFPKYKAFASKEEFEQKGDKVLANPYLKKLDPLPNQPAQDNPSSLY